MQGRGQGRAPGWLREEQILEVLADGKVNSSHPFLEAA